MNTYPMVIQPTLSRFRLFQKSVNAEDADLRTSSGLPRGQRAGNAGPFFGGRHVGGSACPGTSQKCVHLQWDAGSKKNALTTTIRGTVHPGGKHYFFESADHRYLMYLTCQSKSMGGVRPLAFNDSYSSLIFLQVDASKAKTRTR